MGRKAKVFALERATELEGASDLSELKDRFASSIADFGYTTFSVAGFPRRREPIVHEIYFDAFPPGFLEDYVAGYLKVDPTLNESLAANGAVLWRDVKAKYAPDRMVRRLFSFISTYGMNDGMNVVIHGPVDYSGLIFLSGRSPDLSPEARAASLLLGTYCHNRAIELKGVRQPIVVASQPRTLTERERECISWVAEGKSDWEIGEILKISESTAHFHIENAKRKLGVHTRVQLVVHAMRLGEITPQA